MFWLALIVTVTGPSEAEPEDGDTLTHESDALAVQSRFTVKLALPLPPSALSSTEVGPDRVSDGSFWQAPNRTAAQKTKTRKRFIKQKG